MHLVKIVGRHLIEILTRLYLNIERASSLASKTNKNIGVVRVQ